MDRTKTLRKRKAFTSKSPKSSRRKRKSYEVSLREDVGIAEFNSSDILLDPKLIGSAIMECLIENDPDGVMEIIEGHLNALNKSKFLKKAGVPRSTMYQLFKKKNPTIHTLAKIIHAAHKDS